MADHRRPPVGKASRPRPTRGQGVKSVLCGHCSERTNESRCLDPIKAMSCKFCIHRVHHPGAGEDDCWMEYVTGEMLKWTKEYTHLMTQRRHVDSNSAAIEAAAAASKVCSKPYPRDRELEFHYQPYNQDDCHPDDLPEAFRSSEQDSSAAGDWLGDVDDSSL